MKKSTQTLLLSLCCASTLGAERYDAQTLNRLGNTRDYESKPKFSQMIQALRRQTDVELSEDELERPWGPLKDPIAPSKIEVKEMGDVSPHGGPEHLDRLPSLTAEEEAEAVDLYRAPITREEKFKPVEPLNERTEVMKKSVAEERVEDVQKRANDFLQRLRNLDLKKNIENTFKREVARQEKPTVSEKSVVPEPEDLSDGKKSGNQDVASKEYPSLKPHMQRAKRGMSEFGQSVSTGFKSMIKKLKISNDDSQKEASREAALEKAVREKFDAREKAAVGEKKHLELKALRKKSVSEPKFDSKDKVEMKKSLKKVDKKKIQEAKAQPKPALKIEIEKKPGAKYVEIKEDDIRDEQLKAGMKAANPEIIRRYKKDLENKSKASKEKRSRRDRRGESESIQSPVRRLIQ